MKSGRNLILAGLMALVPLAAPAATITANCTGMFELDIYTIDTEQAQQDIKKFGPSEVTVSDGEILVKSGDGEYRFDRKAGSLYHNGRDTGVYCTYKVAG